MASAPADRLFQHPDVEPRTRILVLGLGGAGCNSVANMSTFWVEGPPVVAVNTDAQSLAGCEAPRVLQIGHNTTKGLGANGDIHIGRMAVEESIEPLKEMLQGVDILFLAVGLGGGTGSGGAPYLLQVAHQLNVMTICFATLPFPYESDSRKRLAQESLKQLQRVADAVICLPNEKLIDLVDPQSGLQEAFRKADDQVAATIHALWHLLSFRGVLNLDFADLRHLVERSRGICYFGFGEASGPARVASAVKALIDSPYLNKGRSISEATALLINITGGPDLTLADMQGIMSQIGKMTAPNATMYFGAMIDPAMKNRIALTAVATDASAKAPEKASDDDVEPDAAANEPKPTPPTTGSKRRVKGDDKQAELLFPKEDKGKFTHATPTHFRGEDLDIPTYVRRGYKLSFER
ncbi:MAG TPA: cell division protein FtsZ [Kiritimatiellia bacterium]|nr:cell division protein FtsZ [Kiritimatiellia bacterium]HMP00313.1 cell division protein FtsZ [Kiritimatiellia bacterium]HMP97416.1 cell division protein FtsZ [Kiritimatiellia bacterium]